MGRHNLEESSPDIEDERDRTRLCGALIASVSKQRKRENEK